MKGVNFTVDDKDNARKARTGLTWKALAMRGIEAVEKEKAGK